jgi:hypothetical protein
LLCSEIAYTLLDMKTTIDIEDRLYQAAMKRAEPGERTFSDMVEVALRVYLRDSLPFELWWITTRGKLKPGINIDSRESLYDAMDGIPPVSD